MFVIKQTPNKRSKTLQQEYQPYCKTQYSIPLREDGNRQKQEIRFWKSSVKWKESSTSLTRARAPSFQIPRAERFSSFCEDAMAKTSKTKRSYTESEFVEKKSAGISFAKSKRINLYVKKDNTVELSPASYMTTKYTDTFCQNKEQTRRLQTQSAPRVRQSILFTIEGERIKGVKFNQFQDYHKQYVHHSKNKHYQSYNTMAYPAPGAYNQTWADKKKQVKFSFRLPLKKYHEQNNNPGPNSYAVKTEPKQQSFNAKGTMPKSERKFLTKFNANPAPNNYPVPRFCEKAQK